MEGKTFVVEGRPELGRGRVEEVAGGIAYMTMSNGVEMEFDIKLLKTPPAKSNINESWFNAFIDRETEELAKSYHELITMRNHPKETAWQKMQVVAKVSVIAKLAGSDPQKLYQALVSKRMQPAQVGEAINKKLIATGNKVHLEKVKSEVKEAA